MAWLLKDQECSFFEGDWFSGAYGFVKRIRGLNFVARNAFSWAWWALIQFLWHGYNKGQGRSCSAGICFYWAGWLLFLGAFFCGKSLWDVLGVVSVLTTKHALG